MGMIRSVASWGVEVGCRGQREWREEMESLQYAALRKCTAAVLGSRRSLVWGVAAVEDVETFARAAAGRFLARTMCDLVRARVAAEDDPLLGGLGSLALRGACWRGVIEVVNLGFGGEASVEEWKAAIGRTRGDSDLLFTDGSRDKLGRVGGGWWSFRRGSGSVAVGTVATIGDGDRRYVTGFGFGAGLPSFGSCRFPGGNCFGAECGGLRFGEDSGPASCS